MISFRNVRKSFGDREVLKDISFDVPAGEILFILGTSGTGKSVLLKNVVGLLKPNAGEIIIDGQDVVPLSETEMYPIRKICGMVFQQPALFDSLTIYENVAFGLRKHSPELDESQVRARVKECLALVHLQGIEDKTPQEISYGMQKRVSLARTVAVNPRYLLFDEPTTGLDPVTTNAINTLIRELSKKLKTTSIVVSHDMQCALDIADHILVLDQGHIVDQGSPEQLKKSLKPLVQDFLREALSAEAGH